MVRQMHARAHLPLLLSVCVYLLRLATSQLYFLSLGDWGTGTSIQKSVARQLALTAQEHDPKFLLSLGDNFYESGVRNDTDPLWRSYYTDVYNQTSVQIPWYPILGNHDWKGSPEAQIEFYSNHLDSRWVFPDYYYTKHFTSLSCDGDTCKEFSMDLIFIDTAILAPDQYNGLFPTDPHQYTDAHMQWLEDQLASSNATWIIVIGHYPVLSLGEHGDTTTLVDDLKPLLERYNVDMYICGHDHTLQHITNNGITYFVNGNGARTDGSWSMTPSEHEAAHEGENEKIDFISLDHGFMLHEVTVDSLTSYMINTTGTIIYTNTIQPSDKSRLTPFWASPVAIVLYAVAGLLLVCMVAWLAYRRARRRDSRDNAAESLRHLLQRGFATSPQSEDDSRMEFVVQERAKAGEV